MRRRARFEREARLAAALDHPNIRTIYEVGDHAGVPLIAMQYLDGDTLQDVLRRGPLTLDRLLSVATQVAERTGGGTRPGIIHRDMKPGNVSLTSNGRARVLDFSVAKLLEHMRGAASAPDRTLSMIVGTVASWLDREERDITRCLIEAIGFGGSWDGRHVRLTDGDSGNVPRGSNYRAAMAEPFRARRSAVAT
jgi:eukaryotic-like serine/threonine-protein kinase